MISTRKIFRHIFLFVIWMLPVAVAQFNFFDMFGQGHQTQQNRGSGASQWAAQADGIQCNAYLCPDTLLCVRNPADCPCPHPEDVKCLIREPKEKDAATVVCARGADACSEVQRLANKWK
ncbi:LCL2 [Sanghuangporus weigelae]